MNYNFTITQPSFELLEPCTSENYLQFLELCARNCYKSEDKICEGSAEKLLSKVVNDFGHYSITEHANCILLINNEFIARDLFKELVTIVPCFGPRISFRGEYEESMIVSGNLRMWKEWTQKHPPPGHSKCAIGHGIDFCLEKQWPFFFTSDGREHRDIKLLDCNPVTNKDDLLHIEMLKHMTLTGRFIGSRAMSHQLVRHRMASFSQESMRFCNYGKKGLQVILPESLKTAERYTCFLWEQGVHDAYKLYLKLLSKGIPPEDARFVLPHETKTEVIMTTTLDMWGHIFHHRGRNKKAQWEIRQLVQDAENKIDNLLGWRITDARSFK